MDSRIPFLPTHFQKFIHFLKTRKISPKLVFIVLGILSTIWFLIRVVPKPSRASYPCMQTIAPFMSGFVIYLLGLAGSVFTFSQFKTFLNQRKYVLATVFLFLSASFYMLSFVQHDAPAQAQILSLQNEVTPNDPIGEALGIFPGRVVWIMDKEATNENITNSYSSNHSDAYFSDENTNQARIDQMLRDAVLKLTEESSIAGAWDAIFRYHNEQRGKGNVGYQAGEIIFIKTNATSSWGGNYNTTDLSRANNGNYAISETAPQLVTSVLRHLVNTLGVAQNDIYIGDPMKHIYKDLYEKWHGEFPDVHYLDVAYNSLGREAVVESNTAIIDYSDRGTVLRTGSWSDATVGDPIQIDHLYTIFEEMEYMINIPTMKGHERAGATMFAKNHFGSHTRGDAKHLHGGLVNVNSNPADHRNTYGLYRVQVDIMGHELLGKKNLVFLMDALYTSEHEVNKPDKWQKPPWNNDWTSSIFISQDPVAIESVGFDFLYYEFDGTNGLANYPHYGAVDDYLHQAADPSQWPVGITYDPENDGTPLKSLGVHEHWNNSTDMQYSRNLGTGNGIELVKIDNSGVSIHEFTDAKQMIWYPNPFVSEITVTCSLHGKTRMMIYDIRGKVILEEEWTNEFHKRYNLSNLNSGIYFAIFENSGKRTAHKIIKK